MTDNSKQNDFVSSMTITPAPLMLEYRPPVLVTLKALDLNFQSWNMIPYPPMIYPIPQKHDPDEFRNSILNNYEKTSTEQRYDDSEVGT